MRAAARKSHARHDPGRVTDMLFAGTSGFSYASWKGTFYPANLAGSKMLGYYAERLNGVELNGSFYRTPPEATLLKWASETPPGFRFWARRVRLGDRDGALRVATQPAADAAGLDVAGLAARLVAGRDTPAGLVTGAGLRAVLARVSLGHSGRPPRRCLGLAGRRSGSTPHLLRHVTLRVRGIVCDAPSA